MSRKPGFQCPDAGAKTSLSVRNRQHAKPINAILLRRLARTLLRDLLGRERFDLAIHVVDAAEMTRLNETFLRHRGSTDVIAFDYGDGAEPAVLHGELFVCVDEALIQARRYHTTWRSELLRYVIHGTLHLCGYDDHRAGDRRRMKRAENRLLARLSSHLAQRHPI